MKHASRTLGSGNIKLAVQLPDGEDLNEWIAVNSKLVHRPASPSFTEGLVKLTYSISVILYVVWWII